MPITSMPQLRYRFDSASVENAGPFHAQIRAAVLCVDAGLRGRRRSATLRELRADGMREADVRDQAFAEERRDASARAVDELIRNHEVERLVFFLERADRAERENAFHAQRFHSVDVGAEIQLRRRDAMAAAVARQKRDFFARPACPTMYASDGAPHGVSIVTLFLRFKSGHRVQSAAADDSNGWFHSCMSSSSTPPVEAGMHEDVEMSAGAGARLVQQARS